MFILCLNHILRSTKLKGVYWFHLVRLFVRPSVRLSGCWQNHVSLVSSAILAGSILYLDILSTNCRRCLVCWVLRKIQKLVLLIISLMLHLCLCHVSMWMLKVDSSSEFSLQQLLIFYGDTSRCFIQHTCRIGPKLECCIFGNFFNRTISLTVCRGNEITLILHISFCCSHFEGPDIADVSWPTWELIRFWSSSFDFPYFVGSCLNETGQICYFWASSWEHKKGIASSLACCCIFDHLWNRLDFGHGLLIFLILAPLWLSETSQMWGVRDFLYNALEEWH